MSRAHRFYRNCAVLITLACALTAAAAPSPTGTSARKRHRKPPLTTVYSEVRKDYKREMLPTGKWKPETYAFAQGTVFDREGGDESLHYFTFRELGAIIANSLATQQYIPTPSAEKTDLLIVVHWGKTVPFDNGLQDQALQDLGNIMAGGMDVPYGQDPSIDDGAFDQAMALQRMGQQARDDANRFNARLLGYARKLDDLNSWGELIPPLQSYHRELVDEVETPRYFVILQAFDFQKAWKEKKLELRWITRMSISAQKRKFNDDLAAMLAAAAESFGANSGKLIRDARAPETEYGELEVLGVEK